LSREIVSLLAGAFSLDQREEEILASPLRDLDRRGRRLYFARLRPREGEFRDFLHKRYASLSEEEKQAWRDFTVASMLDRRGEPDLADVLAMAPPGRLSMYREMRRQAEERGVVLRAMTSFGGVGLALYAFLFLVLAVILLRYVLR